MRRNWIAAITLVGTLLASTSVQAIALRNNMGGDQGYGLPENVFFRNDDSSDGPLPIGFEVNFFGARFTEFYLNNNGNITFGQPVGGFTPLPFGTDPGLGGNDTRMIAPFWADVDTRPANGGTVTVGTSDAGENLSVTWHDVGYYNQQTDQTNDFQLTLINRSDTGSGNFDIEFRYNRLEWTTGDASGGVDGHAGPDGTPAQAGYDAGNGLNFLTLPGSFTEGVLDLVNMTNVNGPGVFDVGDPNAGLWLFEVRNGGLGDGTIGAPFQPEDTNEEGGFVFDFQVTDQTPVFIDPFVAVGYDYEILNNGPNILSAIFPTFAGQGNYTINDLSGNFIASVANGGTYDFGGAGVGGFQLRGINPDLMLDPTNPNAFVTGLVFNIAGPTNIQISQTPFQVFVPDAIPEPSTWAMMILGFGAIGGVMRRRRPSLAWA